MFDWNLVFVVMLVEYGRGRGGESESWTIRCEKR